MLAERIGNLVNISWDQRKEVCELHLWSLGCLIAFILTVKEGNGFITQIKPEKFMETRHERYNSQWSALLLLH
jgi:hypothetical protein